MRTDDGARDERRIGRRTVLAAAGMSLAALAGCSESSSGDPEYGSGGNASSGGDPENGSADAESEELPDSEAVVDRPGGEDHLAHGPLEITEESMSVESDEFMSEVTVSGVVENTGSERFDYVEVAVRVYDSDGRHLDRYIDNTSDLSGETEWAFDIWVGEEPEQIAEYDIAVIGNQY